ncbi:pilus assembly protein PilS, partial [Neisseria meningitidis]
EVTRNLKQAKPNGLDSRLRGNDSVSISNFNPLYFTQTI